MTNLEHAPITERLFSSAHPLTMEVVETPDEGEQIRGLVAQTGMDLADLPIESWHNLFPYWIAAKRGDTVLGAVQCTPGRPVGRLELMCVEKELGDRERGRIVRALITQGMRVLQAQGSLVMTAMVSHQDKGFKRAMKKRGFKVLLTGSTLGRAL